MAQRTTKTVKESQVEMTELVLPNDTNRLGNLLGGRLMHLMDIAGAIAATRHTNHVCVTASVDEMNFLHPIKQGDVVILQASVNRVFSSSMEVGIRVTLENPLSGQRKHANSAYFTYVALDDAGIPVPANQVRPVSKVEKRRHADAARRRRQRLQHRKRTSP